MEPWQIGLIVFAALGLAVLSIAYVRDRTTARRVKEALKSPPDRDIPRFDPSVPRPEYLTELESRDDPPGVASTALTDDDRVALRELITTDAAHRMVGGYPIREFATDRDTGWSVLDGPVVLIAADEVTSMRELLPVIETAAQRPLVIVAPGFSNEVVDTLRVNKSQRKLRVCPVLTAEDPHVLAGLLDGQPLTGSDLRSGYVPDAALGHPSRWVCDDSQSWIIV